MPRLHRTRVALVERRHHMCAHWRQQQHHHQQQQPICRSCRPPSPRSVCVFGTASNRSHRHRRKHDAGCVRVQAGREASAGPRADERARDWRLGQQRVHALCGRRHGQHNTGSARAVGWRRWCRGDGLWPAVPRLLFARAKRQRVGPGRRHVQLGPPRPRRRDHTGTGGQHERLRGPAGRHCCTPGGLGSADAEDPGGAHRQP
mmetsp:Transcript_4981/g.7646  ORF Transcript_4981/g.7646 Transcript_4981/m.7646 type:complete len:203 (+) Transcript_4981:110-718(+)